MDYPCIRRYEPVEGNARLRLEAKRAGSLQPGSNRYGKPYNASQVTISVGQAFFKAMQVLAAGDCADVALRDLPASRAKAGSVAIAAKTLDIVIFWVAEDGMGCALTTARGSTDLSVVLLVVCGVAAVLVVRAAARMPGMATSGGRMATSGGSVMLTHLSVPRRRSTMLSGTRVVIHASDRPWRLNLARAPVDEGQVHVQGLQPHLAILGSEVLARLGEDCQQSLDQGVLHDRWPLLAIVDSTTVTATAVLSIIGWQDLIAGRHHKLRPPVDEEPGLLSGTHKHLTGRRHLLGTDPKGTDASLKTNVVGNVRPPLKSAKSCAYKGTFRKASTFAPLSASSSALTPRSVVVIFIPLPPSSPKSLPAETRSRKVPLPHFVFRAAAS